VHKTMGVRQCVCIPRLGKGGAGPAGGGSITENG
jgi:hypothetical protein